MTLEFIEGNCHFEFLNIIVNGNEVMLGECIINVVNGNKTKTIRIVKQDKWYLYIPIMIHEFAHYFVDLIFPFRGDNYEVISKHNLVEVIFNLNRMYLIKKEVEIYL